jgi:prepilin-type N-terminal cleavage/methylation domain-containing protein
MSERRRGDSGFTLIEALMVIAMLGLIAAVLAATFTVIVRTQPPTEATIDDARTLLGITTYLPEDVDSTPAAGFDLPTTRTDSDNQPTGCSGNATDGFSLLHLTWTETVGSTTTYIANYRAIPEPAGTRIVRYSCVNGGTASRVNMTSVLPAIPASWDPGEAPIRFALVGTDGIDVEITTIDGETQSLEARSNNPSETLPPAPPVVFPPIPAGNLPPTADGVDTTTPVDTPVTIALTVQDPDVGDALVVIPTNPTVSAATPGWDAVVSGFDVTVTPPASAPEGEVATFTFRARDPYGQQSSPATVTVTLVAAPVNNPPFALDVSGTVVTGTPLLINLPVGDPDGDPLLITIGTHGDGLTATVDQTTRIMTVVSDGSDETPGSFTYTVNDGRGGVSTGTVNLTVQICRITSFSPMSTSVPRRNGNHRLQSSVTYTVAYTGPCTDLVLVFDHDGSAGTQPEVLSFAGNPTVTVLGHPGGLQNWSLGPHNMDLRNGVTGPNLRTAVLTVT